MCAITQYFIRLCIQSSEETRHKLAAIKNARQFGWIDDDGFIAARESAYETARISLQNETNGSLIMQAYLQIDDDDDDDDDD